MQQMSMTLVFMFLLYLDKFHHCTAAPLIDSKSGVEICPNEGDLLGECKDSRFCICNGDHKWVCSFDVRTIFGEPGYKAFRDICTDCRDVCERNNVNVPNVNVTLQYLINQEKTYIDTALADICNVSEPCLNNGTCNSTGQSYKCHCDTGWNGTNCELDIDECLDNPCNTSADDCINTPGSYRCICPPGLTGDLCIYDVDECNDGSLTNDSLCFNNGSCVNSYGSYTCNCSAEWTGSKCETDVDECDLNVCPLNTSKSCINACGSFYCVCMTGWTGELCLEDVNECESNSTCLNGGICHNTGGSFVCNCTAEWGGPLCDYPILYAERIMYWNNPENHQRQLEYLNVSLQQIKSNLTIDRSLLTSERIKRISAPDRRTSAAITGYIGAGVLSFVFGLLLCFDITFCCTVRKFKR